MSMSRTRSFQPIVRLLTFERMLVNTIVSLETWKAWEGAHFDMQVSQRVWPHGNTRGLQDAAPDIPDLQSQAIKQIRERCENISKQERHKWGLTCPRLLREASCSGRHPSHGSPHYHWRPSGHPFPAQCESPKAPSSDASLHLEQSLPAPKSPPRENANSQHEKPPPSWH